MKELFIKFLKKHGALRKFKVALKAYRTITFDIYCDKAFGDISGAFIWTYTSEGYEYWSNLSDLWEEYKVKNAERTK